MKRLVWGAILAIAALSGCGIDGDPVPPAARTTPGVSVSGEVLIGAQARL